MALVTMSKEELDRFSVIRDVIARRMKPRAAADILGISRRQLFRLKAHYLSHEAEGLVSRHRGKPSNHKLPDDVRRQVLAIVKERYPDFGPTLAREKLQQLH